MDQAEKNYLLERAEAELDLANEARHRNVAYAHYHLAAYYLDRVYGGAANDD